MSVHFEWKQEISVNDENIDSQHKKLLDQVNKIIDAIVFGVDSEKVKADVIYFIENYIEEHFSSEETYMKKIGYPDINNHIKKHHNFIKSFNKIKKDFEEGMNRDELLAKMEKYVGEWWVDHIGKEDRKYKIYLEHKNKIK